MAAAANKLTAGAKELTPRSARKASRYSQVNGGARIDIAKAARPESESPPGGVTMNRDASLRLATALLSFLFCIGCGADQPGDCGGSQNAQVDCTGTPAAACGLDIMNDSHNCGGCGLVCSGADEQSSYCAQGSCSQCPPLLRDCNQKSEDGCEADVGSDPDRCGACDNRCADIENGTRGCNSGVCSIRACTAPFDDCNSQILDGCETNTEADPRNCGSCGTLCPGVVNGAADCQLGTCTLSACTPPYRSCRSGPTEACETNIFTDPDNCGFCGNVCPAIANGTRACSNGTCAVGGCTPPFRDCKNGALDGCETDVSTSAANCGSCGNVCPAPPNATPTCSGGTCGLGTCSSPYANCNGNSGDGCETNVSIDLANCGGCGRVCAPPFANPQCQSGICQIASCTSGHNDCDGQAGNGCESLAASDVNNCGGCGNACPAPPNATPACAFSACGIGSCNNPFLNCNGTLSDGCEINSSNDMNNCGGCGHACGAVFESISVGCQNSACQVVGCSGTYRDCNGVYSDGCEADILTNVNNCGGCGQPCGTPAHSGGALCGGGICRIASCSAPYLDCNGVYGDGCEVDT